MYKDSKKNLTADKKLSTIALGQDFANDLFAVGNR